MASASDILRARLPDGWRVEERAAPGGQGGTLLVVVAPDGRRGSLRLERRDRLDPRSVLAMQVRARRHQEPLPDVVVAPYLSPEVRRRLCEAGIGFADETGNVRISLAEPGLFVEAAGADEDPDPRRRPTRSLAGAKAGRIVRALCTRRQPWGVRELAAATGVSPGYVSRLLAFLDREALVERDDRGRVACKDWERLLRRWAEAAPLETRGRSRLFVAPRGLSSMMRRLQDSDLRHAVTGSFAAARIAPVAPPRLATLYVERLEEAGRSLGLRETRVGANALLIEPRDARVFSEATRGESGICWAPVVQVAADLLSGPGRSPSEAEALLGWMAENEERWRA